MNISKVRQLKNSIKEVIRLQSKDCGRKFRFINILMVCELDYMNICLPRIIEFATPLYLSGVHIEMDFS